jgi:hypothetical protein
MFLQDLSAILYPDGSLGGVDHQINIPCSLRLSLGPVIGAQAHVPPGVDNAENPVAIIGRLRRPEIAASPADQRDITGPAASSRSPPSEDCKRQNRRDKNDKAFGCL